MNNALKTHLTKDGMKDLMNNPGQKMKITVQLKQLTQKNLKDRSMTMAVFSDGFFYEEFLIYPQLADRFKNEIKENDILDINAVVKDSSKTLKLIFDFKKIYEDVEKPIGAPIQFPKDTSEPENPHGSNEIPQNVFLGTPEKLVKEKPMNLEVNDGGGNRVLPVQPVERRTAPRQSDDFYLEIANLNLYDRAWKIKGRILQKTPLRRFNSKGKDGCVFNIVILDSTRKIQGTFFNEVAEKYFETLEIGSVYAFSDGILKKSTRYNITDNKIEVSFTDRSVIEQRPDDPSIPGFSYKFVNIEEIGTLPKDSAIDVICIIHELRDERTVNLKNGNQKQVRDLILKDDSNHTISLTLWGDATSKYELEREIIIILQGVHINEYNGRSLSFFNSSNLITKIPDIQRYKELLAWRNSKDNKQGKFTSLREEKELKELKLVSVDQMINSAKELYDSPEGTKMYFTVIAHIAKFNKNLTYDSCPIDTCKKKLIPTTFGTFECPKCEKTYDKPKPRFFSSSFFEDSTDSFSGKVGGEENALLLTGKTSEELKELSTKGELEFFDFCKKRLFKDYKLRISANKSYYNEQESINYQIINLKPIMKSAGYYCKELINKLKAE